MNATPSIVILWRVLQRHQAAVALARAEIRLSRMVTA